MKTIVKITSGSNKHTANFINELYGSIVSAGVYQASSIRVAEAAKVIENTQRDVNIALVNELAVIFNKMNLDTNEILKQRVLSEFFTFSSGWLVDIASESILII